MPAVPLHVHSHYSLLDGLPKIKSLVKTAKERGFSALALTDSGAMYGAIEFYKSCLDVGIKPIIGVELYLAKNSMKGVAEEDKNFFSLILLAKNYDGYRSLIKLVSVAQTEGFFAGRPRVDKETLARHVRDVVALSGDLRGEIPQLILQRDLGAAEMAARWYTEVFGEGNFFLELGDHPNLFGQNEVNNGLVELSKKTGLPLVVTRDVHYLKPEDAEAQDILTCIRDGLKVEETGREDYRAIDRSLGLPDSFAERFRHVPEAIENSEKIAAMVDIKIELDHWHFAPIDIPVGQTADEFLRLETYSRLKTVYPQADDQLKERIEYELGIISKKGYSPYFLCVADYVRYAKSQGIVETTRGSAAGSVVSYILGITTVDPIRFKLPFERFLNPFRPSPPDIDTDFADDRRDEMIAYVTEKYGRERVAQIITFGTMAARASVRDVGRALGLSYGFCDQVAKLIPMGAQGFPMTIERALKEEPDLKKLYDSNPEVARLLGLAKKVEGCARHTSIHAAGVVISPTPLTDFTPIQLDVEQKHLVTQYEMKSVEAAGVLKNDFLGIRNLSILGKAVEIVEKTTGEKVDIYNLPLDDKLTFEMLARGETMGVFQLSSSGMTRWLKELKPTTIDDIMAMVALYRPGPMESIPEYIKRKYNPETVRYYDERLKEILEASFGLLVYQDDVMLTAIKLAGYDWMEADKFRKAMGKKIPEEMAQQKEKFYDGCLKKGGLARELVDEIWRAIEPFAAYGFNKAHAASYGIVAYQTAYMKAHFPVQYMTAVLQAEAGDADKVSAIVHEAERMGIHVLPPDLNESFKNFAMVSKNGEQGRIRFGLSAIKNVGEHICDVIYRERKENGKYKNLEDLLRRVSDRDLNKKSLESLAAAGALDCFEMDRAVVISNIENILSFSRSLKEEAVSKQSSLFGQSGIGSASLKLKDTRPSTLEERLVWEKNLLGLYISSHPFKPYRQIFGQSLVNLAEVEGHPRDAWINVGGVVESVKRKITKKGSIMLFVSLDDGSGMMELLIFPKTYEVTQSVWVPGKLIAVVGKTPKEDGDNKIFVENVYELTLENSPALARQLGLAFGNGEKNKGMSAPISISKEETKIIKIFVKKEILSAKISEFKKFFARYPGEEVVHFVLENSAEIATSERVNPKASDFALELEQIGGQLSV